MRFCKADDRPAQCRFSATGLPDQRNRLACTNFQIDAVNGTQYAMRRLILNDKIAAGQQRFAHDAIASLLRKQAAA